MTIIDRLTKDEAAGVVDPHTVRVFEAAKATLSPKQIALGEAIIRRTSALTSVERTERIEAFMAPTKANAKVTAETVRAEKAELARGIEAGQTVTWSTKKRGVRTGVVLSVRGEVATVRPSDSEFAADVNTAQVTVL